MIRLQKSVNTACDEWRGFVGDGGDRKFPAARTPYKQPNISQYDTVTVPYYLHSLNFDFSDMTVGKAKRAFYEQYVMFNAVLDAEVYHQQVVDTRPTITSQYFTNLACEKVVEETSALSNLGDFLQIPLDSSKLGTVRVLSATKASELYDTTMLRISEDVAKEQRQKDAAAASLKAKQTRLGNADPATKITRHIEKIFDERFAASGKGKGKGKSKSTDQDSFHASRDGGINYVGAFLAENDPEVLDMVPADFVVPASRRPEVRMATGRGSGTTAQVLRGRGRGRGRSGGKGSEDDKGKGKGKKTGTEKGKDKGKGKDTAQPDSKGKKKGGKGGKK